MKTKTLIKLFIGLIFICSLISSCITYVVLNNQYKNKYRSDETLKKEFDSLMIVIDIKSREAKEIRYAYDSVVYVSANQSKEIDSLIKNKNVQKSKNEKKYRNIANLTDDKQDSILSSKL